MESCKGFYYIALEACTQQAQTYRAACANKKMSALGMLTINQWPINC